MNVLADEIWSGTAQTAEVLLRLLVVGVVCLASYLFVRFVAVRALEFAVRRSGWLWDDVIAERGVFRKLAWIAPALVLSNFSRIGYLPLDARSEPLLSRVISAYTLFVFIFAISDVLTAVNQIYVAEVAFARSRPIKGYLQVFKLVMYVAGLVVIVAILLDRSPVVFLSGLGAMTAVLLLVFRDTLLSLVASIQIASNDMVRIGDWISMPKYDADGDVVDIALHTVKVQNWDKTITTIPTFKLIEDSFKNWRGMQEAGGRRISRAIAIDMTSVRFLSEEDLDRLGKIAVLQRYLAERRETIRAHNAALAVDRTVPVNGRQLTNLGTFRAYLQLYLVAHPRIHHELTLMVRQLEPTAHGIQIQVYCFTRTTVWSEYESIQADLFDHILAALPLFGLRVYQQPSSYDFMALGGKGQREN